MEWEYYLLSDPRVGASCYNVQPVSGQLNELGAQGWELVAAFPTSMLGGTVTVVYVFKRAKTSA